MLKVGLTGNIGSGKSTVGEMFRELGARVVDSDAIVHGLLEPGEPVYEAVVGAFGRGILTEGARIDREALGRIVFADPARRRELNALVHPAVGERQEEFLEKALGEDPGGVAIVDAALMIETGSYRRYDRVVLVRSAPGRQRERLARRGMAADEIERRIAAQMPVEEKLAYADYVIDNSGSLAGTRRQVEAVWEALRAAARQGRSR
jgi:dephospho-CoA kinase